MQEIFQPGTTLEGRYRLVSEPALQDLGHLYRGYDTIDDQLVMVLVLPFEIAAGSDVLSHLSRVQRAVAALGEPRLVSYEYGGLAEDRLYLVRRHVEGRPLADLLADGPLDPTTAAGIAIALADLVALLHRAGMIHGSLCPYCVYVDSSAGALAVAVTDCGLLPALREVQSPYGGPWGRPPYLSPEQAAGEEIHPAADVYVIGSLLYTMLAGRPPFRAADETVLVVQHLRQEPPALDVLLPGLPPALVQIVHTALAKEPAARYRNAGQLAQILRSQTGALPGGGQPPPGAGAHLRVPAPSSGPLIVRAGGPQARPLHQGIDWVMIALIIAALLAMLGVVRLWRTVYDVYTAPGASVPLLTHVASTAGLGDGKDASPVNWVSGRFTFQSPSLPVFQPSTPSPPCRSKGWSIAPLSGIIAVPRDLRAGWGVRNREPGCGVKLTGFAARLC